MSSGAKRFFFKHWSARTKKLHKMNLKKKLVITLRTKLFYTTFITTPESMLQCIANSQNSQPGNYTTTPPSLHQLCCARITCHAQAATQWHFVQFFSHFHPPSNGSGCALKRIFNLYAVVYNNMQFYSSSKPISSQNCLKF